MPKAGINNILFNEIRLKPADILIMKFGKDGFNRQTAMFSYLSVSKSQSFDILFHKLQYFSSLLISAYFQ